MKFFDALKRASAKPAPAPAPLTRTPRKPVHNKQEDVVKRLRNGRTQAKSETPVFSRKAAQKKPNRPPEVSMSLAQLQAQWESDEGIEEVVATDPKPEPKPEPNAVEVDRTKTRLIGFDESQRIALDPFGTAQPVEKAAQTKFPVGWLVVTDGPGRGESFTLLTGMSQIGRGADQAVSLDFGDKAISRQNHAAIVYDTATHSFLIGHGGKANLVRLNGRPLISNETMSNNDEIKIGDTTLKLVVFSGPDFNWSIPAEASDVAEA